MDKLNYYSFLKGLKVGMGLKSMHLVLGSPDTPTLCLYGTPSESGNIGLRVGDTVTMYSGAVLPNVDTVYTDDLKAKYPCIFVNRLNDEYTYLELVSQIKYMSDSREILAAAYPHKSYELQNNAWVYKYEVEYGYGNTGFSTMTRPLYWANVDIYSEDGTELRFETFDPIPVSGLVGYKYGESKVLPDINTVYTDELREQCPYAVIENIAHQWWYLYLSTVPLILHSENSCLYYVGTTDGNAFGYEYDKNAEMWIRDESSDEVITQNSGIESGGASWLDWSNFDVLYEDGSMYNAKSNPIPVYE